MKGSYKIKKVEFILGNIFEELVAGLDLEELKTVDGLSRYKFDLKNGRIYDLKQEEWLNPSPSKARGYCYVNLQKDNKDRKVASVHSLILLAALDGFDFRKFYKGLNLVLDHKNRKRDDNRFINLTIVPQSKNLEGRKTNPKRLSDEKLQELYKDFILIDINVNTNMYIFARLRMYKITRFPRLNDALIGMNHQRL